MHSYAEPLCMGHVWLTHGRQGQALGAAARLLSRRHRPDCDCSDCLRNCEVLAVRIIAGLFLIGAGLVKWLRRYDYAHGPRVDGVTAASWQSSVFTRNRTDLPWQQHHDDAVALTTSAIHVHGVGEPCNGKCITPFLSQRVKNELREQFRADQKGEG